MKYAIDCFEIIGIASNAINGIGWKNKQAALIYFARSLFGDTFNGRYSGIDYRCYGHKAILHTHPHARTYRDARKRVVRNDNRDTRDIGKQLFEAAQQCATTR